MDILVRAGIIKSDNLTGPEYDIRLITPCGLNYAKNLGKMLTRNGGNECEKGVVVRRYFARDNERGKSDFIEVGEQFGQGSPRINLHLGFEEGYYFKEGVPLCIL